MKHIRLATEEEVNRIKKGSDLGGDPFQVLAMENKAGEVDLVVIKQVMEVDPVFYAPSTNDIQKARLIWGIEERLLGAGINRYGFNVAASDERWCKVVESWGAKRQSSEPEFRYFKELK